MGGSYLLNKELLFISRSPEVLGKAILFLMEHAKEGEGPSEKRKARYHEVFKSIPRTETLLFSCPCVLRLGSGYKSGRVYIGSAHICFSAKPLFGKKRAIVIGMGDVLAIERATKLLINQCLIIATYEKKYIFHGLGSRDRAYNTVLSVWRTVTRNRENVCSVFQAGELASLRLKEAEENVCEEQLFPAEMEKVLSLILSREKAVRFYSDLGDNLAVVQAFANRRRLYFANEAVEEVYMVEKDRVTIRCHSRAPLCEIEISSVGNETKIKITEQYRYTMNHYFAYIAYLLGEEQLMDRRFKMYTWVYLGTALGILGKLLVNDVLVHLHLPGKLFK
jgi:GRAM domain